MNKAKILSFFLILFGASLSLIAQPTKVRGKITDAATGAPVPFATIVFVGTTQGTSSDFDGVYFMETRDEVDSIEVAFTGYTSQKFAVNKHAYTNIDVALQENIQMLGEVIIKPGENPAHRIIKGIVENKAKNNPQKNNVYEYESYKKMEMQLSNIDEKFKKRRILKKFQFIFNHVDTSAVTGKSFLPFLITETLSDIYHSNNPKVNKEIIKATKISGFDGDNTSIAQFTGQLYQDFNIYDNYIQLFGQGFVSPANNKGLLFYNYYLTDSADYKGHYCYHLSFKPKNPQDATFTGDFWVTANDFAIVDVQMRITNKVNINWVNDVLIAEEFERKNDSVWFWKNRKMLVDFMLVKSDSTKQKGFIGKSTSNYRNVRFNVPYNQRYNRMQSNVSVKTGALEYSDDFWDKNRPYKLSDSEKAIYTMVDSIKDVPLYRTIADIISAAITGYYNFGNGFEIGPYHKTLSFNEIEGSRFRLGGQTTSDLSSRVRLSGHVAYGTEDKKWKYGLGALVKFSDKNELWEAAQVSYNYDMEQLGKNAQAVFSTGNILGSVLSRSTQDKLTMLKELEAHYEKEWVEGFSNKLTYRNKEIIPSSFVPFTPVSATKGTVGKKIRTNEISLNTRWAPKERVLRRTFSRKHIGGRLPIFNLDLTVGFGDYRYDKIDLSVEHTIPVYPIGHTYYYIKAGQLFGKVPFPLLHLHEGNETYILDPYAFNMMNYYEFASDRYASLAAEHHFMGFFTNKIPFLKKLNCRTVVSLKSIWGDLQKENNPAVTGSTATVLFPSGLTSLQKPYFEAGIGLENILKIIRVDAVWRLSHLDKEGDNIKKFGIRATLQLTF